MAGLGEVCSHIASILFYLETLVRIQGTQPTCTQEKCQWVIPSYLRNAEYLPIKDIDFTSAKGKKRKLDDAIQQDGDDETTEQRAITMGKESTESEMETLFDNLSHGGTKPLVLSLIPEYSDEYVPKSTLDTFPVPLKSLQQSSHISLSYPRLLQVCESIEIELTCEMAQSVEKATQSQSSSKLWFTYRAGRVTASRMKAVCHTNVANPSQSLVKSICYPEAFSFVSKQTAWGCKHEKKARDIYCRITSSSHDDFHVLDSGLVINPQWPFIGASPDGVIECSCCGKGVLEIKCPFCHRDSSIISAAKEDPKFCLKEVDGKLTLDETHSYYYQVQTQLFVCDAHYSDFCVCTFASEGDQENVHIERIYKNHSFWNEECVPKARLFFRTCLLPELLGNWYTRPTEFPNANLEAYVDTEPKYCYCRGPEEGSMIACDNPDCTVMWFHFKCLKLTTTPKGKWYCPNCRKLAQFTRSRKK